MVCGVRTLLWRTDNRTGNVCVRCVLCVVCRYPQQHTRGAVQFRKRLPFQQYNRNKRLLYIIGLNVYYGDSARIVATCLSIRFCLLLLFSEVILLLEVIFKLPQRDLQCVSMRIYACLYEYCCFFIGLRS